VLSKSPSRFKRTLGSKWNDIQDSYTKPLSVSATNLKSFMNRDFFLILFSIQRPNIPEPVSRRLYRKTYRFPIHQGPVRGCN
jgi:hypothetical protein